jgi:hypothetical protein
MAVKYPVLMELGIVEHLQAKKKHCRLMPCCALTWNPQLDRELSGNPGIQLWNPGLTSWPN